MRTLVIGDIHGAYKCLIEVLEKAGPADRVVFLGDYVDGLPQTFEVVEHIRKMPSAVCIRGNHDQWAIEWLDRCKELRNYQWRPDAIHYDQGGKSTYLSYMNKADAPFHMNEHHQFLKATLPHFVDEAGRVYVHGGFDLRGIGAPDMVKMWDRDLMQGAYRMSKNPPKGSTPAPYSMYPEIYIGHTATKLFTEKEEPANWLNLWCMDTNCGWGGPLVAMDVDTKEMFYSQPARDHYPDYKGR